MSLWLEEEGTALIGSGRYHDNTAARIRRLDEHAQIVMIERSGYVSYANCGLPYYVGGVIKEQEELTLQTPESFWDRFRIDVRVRQEVTAINPTEKTVTVHALDSGKVYTETYDKLLLAPGAKPTVPALSGVSSERVFTLRTVEDTLRIRRFVEDQKPKTAVLAGGGFIGLIDRKVKFCDDGTIHPWLSNIVPEHPSFVARKEPNNDSNGN